MRKYALLAVVCSFIVLVMLEFVPSAFACTCDESSMPTPLEAYEGSVAVFSGVVESISEDEVGGWSFTKVTFSVLDCWKGAPESSIIISTFSSCAYFFDVGQEYLVYGYDCCEPIPYPSAWQCDRTQPLAGAAYDLAQLGDPSCFVSVEDVSWGSVKARYR